MSEQNASSENDPNTADQSDDPNGHTNSVANPAPGSATKSKLRKIPPIPMRRKNYCDSGESADEEDEEEEEERNELDDDDASSSPIHASALGLNHIRTKAASSARAPSPFLSTSVFSPLDPIGDKKNRERDGADNRIKWAIPRDPGKKVPWSQSKSSKTLSILNPEFQGHHVACNITKEMQSPRFKAILRVTSGRRKKCPADIKSFSHELNSKGVRPFPFWKSRALGHPEEIMAVIRMKFERLKEEVNSDLAIFAGDLVSILESSAESHPEWRGTLEDLLVVARECAIMSAADFWKKCEGIVQNLDDHRQELPMGTLKQAYTRILFILTRCTRLLQFQKEGLFEDENILGLHQLSDLGVYSEKFSGEGNLGKQSSFSGKEATDTKESHAEEQSTSSLSQDHDDQHSVSSSEHLDSGTAKSTDSSRDRMSSWKKLPPPADKNRKKVQEDKGTPSHVKLDSLQPQEKAHMSASDNNEVLITAEGPPVISDASMTTKRVSWGIWVDKKNANYESSMICRICEVEIPTVHVEEHSKICTIVDRCDLKSLTVNERFERVAETLEKIVEICVSNGSDTAGGSPEVGRVFSSSIAEEHVIVSPRENTLSRRFSDDLADCVPDTDNAFVIDDLNGPIDISFNMLSTLTTDQNKAASSAGSTTPRSPLLTPRAFQIGSNTISELENFQQIHKLVDIAHCVAKVNSSDYGTLEFLLDRLEDLKYVIQNRKVDALIVDTFGRRIEKLLQEKYVRLCGQIDDERADSSSTMVDEDSSAEDDTVRSVRASPLNANGKDRTSIEDFEIMKPISRGAFGRVFLARKRATGDLFAIKVLRKADMIRKNAVDSILAERNILISARNPFVVRFFYSFTCRENLYLVMEYLNGGDLYSLLTNLGCLEEDMARVYIAELVLALEYLHSLNVIHRDLKPDNILIAYDGHIKLTDFGLSKVGLINSTDDLSGPAVSNTVLGDNELKTAAQQTLNREQRQKRSAVGTPDYLAPEILLGMEHGKTADWWSVGVILFELLVGIPPFNADHPQKIFDNIMNRDVTWPKVPEEISYEAHDLIGKLLIDNPLQRLGATGAREVKRHPFFKDINWDTLARQKAAFIPSAGAYDTSYFTSRYIWNQDDGHLTAEGSDYDDMTESCSISGSSTFSNQLDEDGDECGNLADFGAPNLSVKYSFSNFSFKNLSQLASINYDLLVKSSQGSTEESKPSVP